MIIVENKSVPATIYVPKNLSEKYDTYVLSLTDRATNKTYEFECEDTGLYVIWYQLLIDFSECPATEYEYILSDAEDENIVAKGLIALKDTEKEQIQYESTIEYVAYDA